MNVDWYFTNKDCMRCSKCRVVDISSDYLEHEYQCDEGHRIEGLMDNLNKPCGLPPNHFYEAEYHIKNNQLDQKS